MRTHRHRAIINQDYGFTHCVNPNHCDPTAHGAVTVVSRCRCGWVKETNRNGGRIEIGAWRAPKPGDYPELMKRVLEGVGEEVKA